MTKIEELQAQLPQSIQDRNSITAFIIQRYLDDLTSYTETVCHEDIEWSDNGESVARASSCHHSNEAEQYEDAEQFLPRDLILGAAIPEPVMSRPNPSPVSLGISTSSGLQQSPRIAHYESSAVVASAAFSIGLMVLFISLLMLSSHTNSCDFGTYLSGLEVCYMSLYCVFSNHKEDVQMLGLFAYGAIMMTFLP